MMELSSGRHSGSRPATAFGGGPVGRLSILLLVLIPCLALAEVMALAEVTRKPDAADGTGSLESMMTSGVQPWSMVQFIGLQGGKGYKRGSFSLVLYRNEPRRWYFSKWKRIIVGSSP
jgi:hypothetical protein